MNTRRPSDDPPDELDFVIPTPRPSVGVRPSMVAVAAAALAIAGLFSLVGAALVGGAGGSSLQVGFVGGFGVAQLVIAVLVFRQVPIGRPAGLAAAGVGFVFGLVRVLDGTGAAALDLVAYAFIIWALATNEAAFRRG
jgi:hypothetical protein